MASLLCVSLLCTIFVRLSQSLAQKTWTILRMPMLPALKPPEWEEIKVIIDVRGIQCITETSLHSVDRTLRWKTEVRVCVSCISIKPRSFFRYFCTTFFFFFLDIFLQFYCVHVILAYETDQTIVIGWETCVHEYIAIYYIYTDTCRKWFCMKKN